MGEKVSMSFDPWVRHKAHINKLRMCACVRSSELQIDTQVLFNASEWLARERRLTKGVVE